MMWWDWAAGVPVAIWTYLLTAHGRFWLVREEPVPAAAIDHWPSVRIIVPARNEADGVAQTVCTLLQQRYEGALHLYLVDDHSTDGTADLARAAAQEAGREHSLTVVSAASLPSGWTGKLWAVHNGLLAATADGEPDYFLLTDADIAHEPDSVRGLVARAEAGGYDLVSYMVLLRNRSLAERALIPAFVFFFFLLYPPAWIARREHRVAGAAGGCVLLRPAALRRIGGIESIRGELIDDCALAARVKEGGAIWLGVTSRTESTRDYQSFGEIAHMISRTAFTQLRYSTLLLAGTLAGLFVTYLLPPMLLLSGWSIPAALGAVAWMLMAIAYVPTLRFYRQSLLWAPMLPLIALFYSAATVQSAVRYWRGAGGQWKGRSQA